MNARRRCAVWWGAVLVAGTLRGEGLNHESLARHFAQRISGSSAAQVRYHATYRNADGSPHTHVYTAELGGETLTLGVAPDRGSFPLMFFYRQAPFDAAAEAEKGGPPEVVLAGAGVFLRDNDGYRRWPSLERVASGAIEAGASSATAEGLLRAPEAALLAARREKAWAAIGSASKGDKDDVEYIVPGVPSYLWYMNCALISETMILAYWDDRGYETLVPGGDSVTGCPWAITEELCWLEWTGSRIGAYAAARELGNDVPFLSTAVPDTKWESYRGALDAHRTPLNVSWGGPPYGAHATVGVGYREDGGQRFLVLHDTWVAPPAYVNYDQYVASLMFFGRNYPAGPPPKGRDAAQGKGSGRRKGVTFQPRALTFSPTLTPSRYSYHSLTAVDIDENGLEDLVVCNFSLVGRQALQVYMNAGGGTFVRDTAFNPALEYYECMRAAKAYDFDRDGDLDVAATGYWAFVRVFVNQGGALSPQSVVVDSTGRGFTDVAWGDFDGDGDGDLAAGTLVGTLRVYRNDGGAFTKAYEVGAGRQFMQVKMLDLSGDGLPELAACDREGSVVVFANAGGGFPGTKLFAPATGHGAMAFDAGDIDRDGSPEIVTVDDGRLAVWDDIGGAATVTHIDAGFECCAKDLTLSDLDADGFPELLVANYTRPNVIFRNAGGRFDPEPLWTSARAEPSTRVHVYDLEGDGRKEIAFLKVRGGTLEFLEATPVPPVEFKRGDANADGRTDLSDPVAILLVLFGGRGEFGCARSADANDSGSVDLADAIAILGYLFAHGAAPADPFAACGADTTADALGCAQYPPCAETP